MRASPEPPPTPATEDEAPDEPEEATAAEVEPTSPPAGTGATVLQFPDRRADAAVIDPGSEAEDEEPADDDVAAEAD